HPASFEANSVLAVLYANQNRNREAIERLHAANQARPRDFKVLALLGDQYFQGRYFEDSIRTLREAIQIKPDSAEVRYLLIQAFEKARALDAHDVFALRGIGQSLIHLARFQEALPELESAVALHPEDAELYFELSQVYARLGERAEADQAVASFRRLRAKELQQE